jgi:hypothetical protein
MPSQFRLDLSLAPGNAREFDLWRGGMSPLFEMDAADAKARSSFGAQLTGYQFADVAIVSGFSSAATFKRTAAVDCAQRDRQHQLACLRRRRLCP